MAGRTLDIRPRTKLPLKAQVKMRKLPSPELTPPLAAISRLRQIMSMTMIINDGAVLDRVLALTNSGDQNKIAREAVALFQGPERVADRSRGGGDRDRDPRATGDDGKNRSRSSVLRRGGGCGGGGRGTGRRRSAARRFHPSGGHEVRLDRPRVRAREHDDLVHHLRTRKPLQGVVDERGVGEREEGLGALEGDGAEGLEREFFLFLLKKKRG